MRVVSLDETSSVLSWTSASGVGSRQANSIWRDEKDGDTLSRESGMRVAYVVSPFRTGRMVADLGEDWTGQG